MLDTMHLRGKEYHKDYVNRSLRDNTLTSKREEDPSVKRPTPTLLKNVVGQGKMRQKKREERRGAEMRSYCVREVPFIKPCPACVAGFSSYATAS